LAVSIGAMQWRAQSADDDMLATSQNEEAIADLEEIDNADRDISASQDQNQYPARVENDSFVIGSPDAPITILEFSSFSCPHCATFHKNTLSDLKNDYVDSGKVKFVFNDFPLNGAAVKASLLMKCVDVENRYDFMEMLFEQQSQWAFESDYQTRLKQYASLLGISNDTAESCMNDTATEQAMFTKMRANNEKYKVQSTPTFVILPSEKIITGAQPYGVFSTEIERLLKEVN